MNYVANYSPLPRETTRSKEHGKLTHLASVLSEYCEKI